jgi:hypothetical protein
MDVNSPPVLSQDAENLSLLAVFHYVVGGIGFLFACFPFIHLVLGLAMITGALDNRKGEAPPAFIGYFFVVIAAVFILMGWTAAACTVYSGRLIAKRKRRMFSFVMGAILCIFMPFGTILGVFTIILLNKDSVKELYAKTA